MEEGSEGRGTEKEEGRERGCIGRLAYGSGGGWVKRWVCRARTGLFDCSLSPSGTSRMGRAPGLGPAEAVTASWEHWASTSPTTGSPVLLHSSGTPQAQLWGGVQGRDAPREFPLLQTP